MATLNLNDLKIRILQLKGLGYDKLLRRDELNDELTKLDSELEAIGAEVTGLMKTLEEATAQIEQQQQQAPPSGVNIQTQEPSNQEQQGQGNVATVEGNLSGTHITVDQNALSAALSPSSKVDTKDSNKRSDKTSHTIGRRS